MNGILSVNSYSREGYVNIHINYEKRDLLPTVVQQKVSGETDEEYRLKSNTFWHRLFGIDKERIPEVFEPISKQSKKIHMLVSKDDIGYFMLWMDDDNSKRDCILYDTQHYRYLLYNAFPVSVSVTGSIEMFFDGIERA